MKIFINNRLIPCLKDHSIKVSNDAVRRRVPIIRPVILMFREMFKRQWEDTCLRDNCTDLQRVVGFFFAGYSSLWLFHNVIFIIWLNVFLTLRTWSWEVVQKLYFYLAPFYRRLLTTLQCPKRFKRPIYRLQCRNHGWHNRGWLSDRRRFSFNISSHVTGGSLLGSRRPVNTWTSCQPEHLTCVCRAMLTYTMSASCFASEINRKHWSRLTGHTHADYVALWWLMDDQHLSTLSWTLSALCIFQKQDLLFAFLLWWYFPPIPIRLFDFSLCLLRKNSDVALMCCCKFNTFWQNTINAFLYTAMPCFLTIGCIV